MIEKQMYTITKTYKTNRNESLSFQLRKTDFQDETVRNFRAICVHLGVPPVHILRNLVRKFLEENENLILPNEPSEPPVS